MQGNPDTIIYGSHILDIIERILFALARTQVECVNLSGGCFLAMRSGQQVPTLKISYSLGDTEVSEGSSRVHYESALGRLARLTSGEYCAAAIRVGDYLMAFSGVSEEIDETLIIVLALHFGWITESDAALICKASGNKVFTVFWSHWLSVNT